MVQWTEKPPPRERAESHGEAVADSQYGTQKKPLRRKRTLTPLYVTMIVLIGAAIPAGYLLLSHMPSASDPAHPKQAARDLTTGRIIIANEAGCRERGFNNYNGQSTEKGAILCNAVAPQSQGLTERLDTIRRAFGPR
jgi:hypothetical protein